MQDIVVTVFGAIFASLTLSLFVFWFVYTVIWYCKSIDNENEYIKSLSDDQKLIIIKYKLNRNIKYFDTFKKGKKDNENK